MFRPSERAGSIPESETLAISALAKRMRAEGIRVANLAAGEPDFDTPEHVRQAAIAAIHEGLCRYTPAAGVPELRQAVAESLRRRRGIAVEAADVLVTAGAKQAIYNVLAVYLDDGDEVLLPMPYWVSYPAMAKAVGGRCTPVESTDRMDLDTAALASAVTDRTRAIILNTPGNPSGAVYSLQSLHEVADLAEEHDLLLIADEIYERFVYSGAGGPGATLPSLTSLWDRVKDRTVLINGVSKSHAMTGWRIGWAVGPRPLIQAATRLSGQTTSCPSSISQAAALAAVTGPDEPVQAMVAEFDRRRRRMVELLNQIQGVVCQTPQGAFYAFPRVDKLLGHSHRGDHIQDSTTLSRLLLERAHVATVPGSAFGDDRRIRLSYAVALEEVERGVQAIADFAGQLE